MPNSKLNKFNPSRSIRISDFQRYSKAALYNYCKLKNIKGCSKLNKLDLTRIIINYIHEKEKEIKNIFNRELNFDEDIFSNDKIKQIPYKRKHIKIYNFDEDIFVKPRIRKQLIQNKAKDLNELPKVFKDNNNNIEVVRARGRIQNVVSEIIKKELERKDSVSIQLVGVVQYQEINLTSECEQQENLRCFEYAIESILNPPKDHTDRPSSYNIKKYETLNMNYPVNVISNNIKKYEEFCNISINIYEFKNTTIDLIHLKIPSIENNIRKYKSNGAEQFHPYTITLDFECTLKKIDNKITDSTKYFQEYIPNSFSFHTVDGVKLIRNSNVETLMKEFNESLIQFGKRYNKIRNQNMKMIWDEDNLVELANTKKCHICKKVFEDISKK
ncbi:hypothetical protein ABEB36_014001 [Hypothenemus hampei]|uniref:Polynucleotide 5'-phosphatase n=1 Tax=Hypothenemus hampei TaxID=57062 RepID=A0ABD1E7L3_HYPHA